MLQRGRKQSTPVQARSEISSVPPPPHTLRPKPFVAQAFTQVHNTMRQDFVPGVVSCAARSAASVKPPDIVGRFSDMRCTPLPKSGARLELSVREFTPIHPISDDKRPYSILGQRFITTFIPAA